MNIGTVKLNAASQLIGTIATLAGTLTIGLAAVTDTKHEKAPKYRVMALNASKQWIVVGALWSLFSNGDGSEFFQGQIDDPTLDKPLSVAFFPQQDGSMTVAWRREQARPAAALSTVSDIPAFPDMQGEEQAVKPMSDDLGESTAPQPPAGGRHREANHPNSETNSETETA